MVIDPGPSGYKTGDLVPSVDSRAFADAIGRLLSSRERHDAIAAAAREHVVRHFSIASTAEKTFEVYQHLLKGHA